MPTQKGGLQPEQENRTKAPRSGIEQVDLFIRSLGGSIRPIRDTLTDFPRPGEVTMVFVTDRLAKWKTAEIAWAARHETGHARHRAITRKGSRKQRRALRKALQEAFDSRSSRLPKAFHKSPAEFLAEGTDWYHRNWLTRGMLKRRAPQLHAILDSKAKVLSLMESDISALEEDGIVLLYDGPEGFAATWEGTDEILFSLNLGDGQEGETIRPDGTIETHGGKCERFGGITISRPILKVWTPEEAEPYKAFLRSKGVTLPHVMS